MNNVIAPDICQYKINAILEEHKKLSIGETINIANIIDKSLEIKIYWEEEMHCNYVDTENIMFKIQDQIDKKAESIAFVYNKRIKEFCDKVEKLEQEHNLPHNQIWKDYLWSQRY